jgi:hypothetical protein
LSSILPTAICETHYNLPALDLLLSSTSSATTVLNQAWVPGLLEDNPNIATIIPCFLRHGLDVDVHDGLLLQRVIERRETDLLRKILDANPSMKSLRSAFNAAIGREVESIDVCALELLLEKAETAEIGQSEALAECTHLALAGDSEGLKFLLRHGARVDHNDGLALVLAAEAGSSDTIKLLLASKPASSSIKRACLAVESSRLSTTQKSGIFSLLLNANGGLSIGDTSNLLSECVVHGQENAQLAKLLLVRGADTSFVTLKRAMIRASPELIVAMVELLEDRDTLVKLFKEARTTLVNYEKAETAEIGQSEALAEALLDLLSATDRDNTSLMKLLLRHGALIGYRNGNAFRRALVSNAIHTVKLFIEYIDDDSVAGVAFAHATAAPLRDQDKRREIYRSLLRYNIRGESLDDALRKTLREKSPSHPILQLLLDTGANPHKENAMCFISTARAGREAEFRLLSRYAKLKVVLPALLTGLEQENQVVKWFQICLKENHTAKIRDQNYLLFHCLHKFPLGTQLLKLLLDNGVSASATQSCSILEGLALENCTALIWAILREPRIGSSTILALIAEGGRKGSSQS